MNIPCFVPVLGSFSSSFTSNKIPQQVSRCPVPDSAASVSAVLGTRVSEHSFTSQAQTYTVKVMQRDRCTLVDVEADTNLRRALIDEKIDLYTFGGKLRNCGGAGQCGTCIVAVEDGLHNMNPRTPKEEVLLKGKPGNWRLACRATLNGEVTITTKPKT